MTTIADATMKKHERAAGRKRLSAGFPSADPFHPKLDLVCFSHLRWDFVFQRPQHLLTRFAAERRTYFIEEPLETDGDAFMEVSRRENGLRVVTPRLPRGAPKEGGMASLVRGLFAAEEIGEHVSWYYSPMAMDFSRGLRPRAVVFDCMDELSAFHGAPPELLRHEAELLRVADLVFTGGDSLYEAKRHRNPRVFSYPSSIDVHHFAQARCLQPDPEDQKGIPFPRLGFAGVIDERMDLPLLSEAARLRPDWQFIMVGPVVKIDPALLPRAANIHYLGQKAYADLPRYMAGWQVALLPFARNEATRYISPTKTPEYLAAGRQVVSTSIRDVVRPYGEEGLVHIADTPEAFVEAARRAMEDRSGAFRRLEKADAFLAASSWDKTWKSMRDRISQALRDRAHG
jgi:UDP-galactopyranose mutase